MNLGGGGVGRGGPHFEDADQEAEHHVLLLQYGINDSVEILLAPAYWMLAGFSTTSSTVTRRPYRSSRTQRPLTPIGLSLD